MTPNTLLGQVLGIFLPKTVTAPDAPLTERAALGSNLELWSRQGVRFSYAEPVPGVHIIVEFPDEAGLAQTVPATPAVRGEGAGFWVNLAEGVGKAANTITFGLVDGILKYDPKAQRKIAEGQQYHIDQQIKAQKDLAAAQVEAENDALVARAQAEAEIAIIMAKAQRRLDNLSGGGGGKDDDAGAFSLARFTTPQTLPAAVRGWPEPTVQGACCTSCAMGKACEGSCHGH